MCRGKQKNVCMKETVKEAYKKWAALIKLGGENTRKGLQFGERAKDENRG